MVYISQLDRPLIKVSLSRFVQGEALSAMPESNICGVDGRKQLPCVGDNQLGALIVRRLRSRVPGDLYDAAREHVCGSTKCKGQQHGRQKTGLQGLVQVHRHGPCRVWLRLMAPPSLSHSLSLSLVVRSWPQAQREEERERECLDTHTHTRTPCSDTDTESSYNSSTDVSVARARP